MLQINLKKEKWLLCQWPACLSWKPYKEMPVCKLLLLKCARNLCAHAKEPRELVQCLSLPDVSAYTGLLFKAFLVLIFLHLV